MVGGIYQTFWWEPISTSCGSGSRHLSEPRRPDQSESSFRLRIFPETQIVRFASLRKLQKKLADGIRQILLEEGELRSSHRYAIVVQDLATQWIQSYPSKAKHFKKRREIYGSFSNPKKIERSYTPTIPWNWKSLRKSSMETHCASIPHRPETNGILEREQ